MAYIACMLLAAGAIGFTLLVRDSDIPPAPVENAELRHLEARRQVLYDNLKDLQFEYHQGKLSDQDYQSLKAGFLYDLATVMASIERASPVKEGRREVEARTASRKGGAKQKPAAPIQQRIAGAGDAAGGVPVAGDIVACPSCTAQNPLANRFCGHCGASLQA